MRYKIALLKTDEGYSVSVPGLPGCWSQGTTEEEALENIQDAIQEYLAVRDDLLDGAVIREVEITPYNVPRIPGVNHQDAVRALQTPSTHLRWAASSAMPGSVKKDSARSCNVWSHTLRIKTGGRAERP